MFLSKEGFRTSYLEWLVGQLTAVVHNGAQSFMHFPDGERPEPLQALNFLPKHRDSKENREQHEKQREREGKLIEQAEREVMMQALQERAKIRRQQLGLE